MKAGTEPGSSLSVGSAQRRDDEHADGKSIKVQVLEVIEKLIVGVIVAEGKEKDQSILKYVLSLFLLVLLALPPCINLCVCGVGSTEFLRVESG